MAAGQIFLIGVASTFLAASTVILCLRPSLKAVLQDLCGTGERARFWTDFSTVTLVLMPLIFALEHRPSPGDGWQSVFGVSEMLREALVGLMAAVFGLGFVLSLYIGRGSPSPVSSSTSRQATGSPSGAPAV